MGVYLCFILTCWVYLTIMGPQVRLCYFIYLLGFLNIMHTLCSYNRTLVNLMDCNTEAFSPS